MKIEFHCHSKEASPDAALTVRELIEQHKAHGYDGLILTNHFSSAMKQTFAQQGVSDYHKLYHDAIHEAERIGKEMDFLVLGGYEIKFDYHEKNEFLVYGMTEEQCRDYEKLLAMKPAEFSEFAKAHNILYYQAHPFRNGMEIVVPSSLYGIEAKNANQRNDSRNDIAAAWAEKFHLPAICGSDVHLSCDIGCSAVLTPRKICCMDDLVQMLKDGDYSLL